MALHQLLNNFTGGEISTQLDARVDLQKYNTSCKRIENMRVRPYGGVTFRSGTMFIAEAKYPDRKCRLIPFTFSTAINYVIEMGHQYMRFYRDGAQVGAPYEISSPFTEDQLFEVQFKQINDVMYLVHPEWPPTKIARVTDTSWTTGFVSFNYPPLLDENTTDTTITPSGTAGAITLTASSAIFDPDHFGAVFEIKHLRQANKVELDISGSTVTSSTLKVKGDWAFVTTERWWGQIDLQRSTDGATWETFRTFTAQADRNVNATGFQETAAEFRIVFTSAGDPYASPPWTGTPPTTYVQARAALEVAEVYMAGLVSISSYTSPTVVSAVVINELEGTGATKFWSEGAWSTYQGYPRTVGLFEQRLFFAGTDLRPNTMWGSVTADFENFAYGEQDDAAVMYQFAAAQQNPIQWIETLLRLHAGTSAGEHIVASGNTDEPLTPSNVTVRDPTGYGSEFLQAVKVENAILFMQRQGRRLREMREYNVLGGGQDNAAVDLTLLAEHLTDAGVRQLAYARIPDPTLYAVLGNGQMAVMAYDRDQNVNGWSRFITDGQFESVAAVYGTPSDVVYCSVKRTIGGSAVRYIEVFRAESTAGFFWTHMDSAKTYNGPVTTVTGLDHLEGKTVAVVAGPDGHVIGDPVTGVGALTVSGGTITLPQEELFVRVGLPYRGQLTPMKLDALLGSGTSQGRRRRITELCLRFKDTLGCKYGTSTVDDPATDRHVNEIPFRDTSNNMDAAPPLFTGDKVVEWNGGNALQLEVNVYQQQALPMTVLGLFAKWDVFGE
jgi:hypothetical protein